MPLATGTTFTLDTIGAGKMMIYGHTIYWYMRAVDMAGNKEMADLPKMIFTLDNMPPSMPVGEITSPMGGEKFKTGSNQLILWQANSIYDAGQLKYLPIRLDCEMSTDNWVTIVNSPIVNGAANTGVFTNWTVPNFPGKQCRIRLTATDSAGNSGSVLSGPFLVYDTIIDTTHAPIDTTRPLMLMDNAGITYFPVVRYTVNAGPNVDSMRVALSSDTASARWKGIAAFDSIDVSGGGYGIKTVCLQFKDKTGVRLSWYGVGTSYVKMDTTLHQGPLLLFDNAGVTYRAVVPYMVNAGPNIDSMRVALSSDTATASWKRVVSSDSIDVSKGGYGMKFICLQFKDKTGLRMQWFIVQTNYAPYGSIDSTQPQAAISIMDNNGFTNHGIVHYSLMIAMPLDSIRVALSADTATASWKRWSPTPIMDTTQKGSDSIDISRGGNGPKYVCAQVKNMSGMVSPWFSDMTLYDTIPPTVSVGMTSHQYSMNTWQGISGTASDNVSGIKRVEVVLYNQTTRQYYKPDSFPQNMRFDSAAGTYRPDTFMIQKPDSGSRQMLSDSAVAAHWSAVPHAFVIVNAATWNVNMDPRVMLTGSYAVYVKAIDNADNSFMPSDTFNFNFTAPPANNSVFKLTSLGDTAIAVSITKNPAVSSTARTLYWAIAYGRQVGPNDTTGKSDAKLYLKMVNWHDTSFVVYNTAIPGWWYIGDGLADSLGNFSQGGGSDSILVKNIPPRFARHADITVRKGTTVVDSLRASDRNGDALTFTLSGVSVGLVLSGAKFTIKTDSAAIGAYRLRAAVADGRGGSAQDSFLLTVLPYYVAPKTVLRKKQIAYGAVWYQMGAVSTTDTLFTFSSRLRTADSGMLIDSQKNGKGSFAFYPLRNGKYRFTCVATDSRGLMDSIGFADSCIITDATAHTYGDTADWQLVSLPSKPMAADQIKNNAFLLHWDETQAERPVYGYYKQTGDIAQVVPGASYWRKSSTPLAVALTPAQVNSDSVTIIKLYGGEYGWNQIGSPYPYPVKFSSAAQLWKWQAASGDSLGDYVPVDSVLEPWSGYWAWTNKTDSIAVSAKPWFGAGSGSAKKAQHFYQDINNWQVQIVLHARGRAVDADNAIGFSRLAKDGFNVLDRFEPPRMSENGYAFIYHPEWNNPVKEYSRDIRNKFAQTNLYQIGIGPLSAPDAYLSFEGVPSSQPFYLFVTKGDSLLPIAAGKRVAVAASGQAQYRTLFATLDKDFVKNFPAQFNVGSPFPNPMHPTSTVRYTLPYVWASNGLMVSSSYEVSIRFFDMRGRVVRELIHHKQDAGHYSAQWDGKSNNGMLVAPGAYICALTAGKFNAVKKIVMIR
ncbi:MAG: FlgD immunoglobulin-like domain containing protein [Chitinivibrionales bacterium]|nr:FlgD immunoglobulin-like domain containing protein [Chitinivibrionales bacterium]